MGNSMKKPKLAYEKVNNAKKKPYYFRALSDESRVTVIELA
jgi:hypothetical protein